MHRRLVAVALACALAATSAACIPQPPESIRKHPYERVMSNVVEAPAGAPVRRARAVVRYHVGKPVWGFMAEAERILLVVRTGEDGKDAEHMMRLGYLRLHWNDDPAPFLAWADRPEYTLRLAPDAHALAIADVTDSTTNGASPAAAPSWSYVALDAGDEPFACPHVKVEADDPFAALPTTRELARAVLATHREGGRVVGHASDDGDGWVDAELRGALRYACAHPDDVALGREVASALVRDGMSPAIWDLATRTKLTECLRGFARSDEPTRATLLATLRGAPTRDLEQRSFAAEGLASLADEDVQRALAASVEATLADKPRFGECDLAAREAWALASVTAERRAAPPEVENALVRIALSDASCLGGATMDVVRANAIRALATLADARAHAEIDALAIGCQAPLPRWPASYENEWEVASKGDWSVASVACWAAAARAPH